MTTYNIFVQSVFLTQQTLNLSFDLVSLTFFYKSFFFVGNIILCPCNILFRPWFDQYNSDSGHGLTVMPVTYLYTVFFARTALNTIV